MLELPTLSRSAASRSAAPRDRGFRVGRHVQLGALVVAGLLLALVASFRHTIEVDQPILEAVQQSLPGWYEGVASFFNVFLRDTGIPILWAATVLGFLVLRRNDYAALFVFLVAISFLTTFLKQTIDRPRPAGDFAILQFPTDPSFPSGHTMTALAFFGLWFIVSSRVLPRPAVWPVRIVCIAAVVMTGISRIWVGAHWPSDVLGALVWGSLFLALVMMTHPFLERLNPPAATPGRHS